MGVAVTRLSVHPVLSPINIGGGERLKPGDVIAVGALSDGDVAEMIRRGVLAPAEERDFPDDGPACGVPVETVADPIGPLVGDEGGGGVAAVAAPATSVKKPRAGKVDP